MDVIDSGEWFGAFFGRNVSLEGFVELAVREALIIGKDNRNSKDDSDFLGRVGLNVSFFLGCSLNLGAREQILYLLNPIYWTLACRGYKSLLIYRQGVKPGESNNIELKRDSGPSDQKEAVSYIMDNYLDYLRARVLKLGDDNRFFIY